MFYRNMIRMIGLVIAVFCLPQSAVAYQAGDHIIRVGLAHVNPQDDSDALPAISGSEVNVDSDSSLGITYTYMMTDDWGVGVLGALPFKHDIDGGGTINGLGTVAETKHLPPTLTLQYHFKPSTKIHPYIGAGLNYTSFFSEDTKGALSASSIDLDDSWGLALEAGVDIEMGNGWMASAQAWYLDIDTEADITGGIFAGAPQKFDVEIDPWVFMISVSKRF